MKLQTPYPCNLPFLVSQKWGENYKYYNDNFGQNGHNGWDFAIPVGTPIYATFDGTVFFAGTDQTGALEISIDSTCTFDYKDTQAQYRSLYGHLSVIKVKPNDKVVKGQLIGLSGNTGRYTTGPHLHYGIHPIANFQDLEPNNGMNGAVDPLHFFDGTYPSGPVKDKRAAAAFALRDWQVSVGIMDFAGETNPDIIRFGPESKKQFNKY